ncbi:MAG TPA: mannitol dehydrogenase family protein [Dongiaceae bacterium]|jgi:tagaturonate reductase|nr:mannitol dehydrogenase family protein [Dongiaceae bacterium]
MTHRIIQFGTSRFLQAHVDLFVHQARLAGQDVGPITVVKTTLGGDRAGRITVLKSGAPFPVRIRGLSNGAAIDEIVAVASVDQAYDVHDEWPAVVHCFVRDSDIAVSNTGDRGYDLAPVDAAHNFASPLPPRSFPAKLLALLLARFHAGGRPLLFLPTELVSRNGDRLAAILSNLAAATGQPGDFRVWLNRDVTFANTLVDRIVSAPIEPIGAVAEPYALWAIERGVFAMPLQHPDVMVVDDLEPLERLKLHILNLGHSVLADRWMRDGRDASETVRGILDDPAIARMLDAIYEDEVVPGFALQGMEAKARRYVATTLERFRNPFLEHHLSDIAQNHAAKLKNRVVAFVSWAREREPNFAAPRLGALL